MTECRALAETIADWGGSVVPARVVFDGGSWTKSSIRGWPQKASRVSSRWPADWFTWGGAWHVALCPRHGGLVAMDLDGENAIDIARQAVKDGIIPWDSPPLAYRTPGHGGGMHIIWRWPASLPAFSRLTAALPEGGEVDMRGESGFVLLVGAPRPDVPGGRYEMVSRPGNEGPPNAPDGIMEWVRSLGPSTAVDAPIHQGKQLDPAELSTLAVSQGGRLTHDRHTTLFRLASYLRVRSGTRTFESLAAKLWELCAERFDLGEEGEEYWMQECVRVAKNAAAYTAERDQRELESVMRLTRFSRPAR